MSDTDAPPVLRRKLAPPRPSKAPGQGALRSMLAKTMPRDADKLLGLQIAVTEVTPGEARKPDVIKGLKPTDLIYLMKADKAAPGLCTLSPGLLSALIEMQMSGRVSTGEAAERTPTRTDGVVASDIVDRWIAAAKAEAAAQDILDRLPFAEHYRAATVPDARNADLALDPGMFRTLSVSLELASGAKSGVLFFAIPVRQERGRTLASGTADEFRDVVREARTALKVVLTRLPRTLAEARRLSVGDTLEVPIDALRAVTLESADGHAVATGRLGQSGGLKAVRITARAEAEDAKAGSTSAPGFMGAALPSGKGAALPDPGVADAVGPGPNVPGGDAARDPALSTEVPALSDMEDLPELPDLPDLPDLPELPDLPD